MASERNISMVAVAQRREYEMLTTILNHFPFSAQEVDRHKMTALHWVCRDHKAPIHVLHQLVLIHPKSTLVKNDKGQIPLHIAIQNRLSLRSLKILLKFYPRTVTVPTQDGKDPLTLAMEASLPHSSTIFLEMLDAEMRALSSKPKVEIIRDDLLTSTFGSNLQLPATWKMDKFCFMCRCRFSYFRTRHHCRNCGESVCGRHSKHSLPLGHVGMDLPQRVCNICYATLTPPPITNESFPLPDFPTRARAHTAAAPPVLSLNPMYEGDVAPMLSTPPPYHRIRSDVRSALEPFTALDSEQDRGNNQLDIVNNVKAPRLSQTELQVTPFVSEHDQQIADHVTQLESQVQKLMLAKQRILDALKKSQKEIAMARSEKGRYEALANEYESKGYCATTLTNVNLNLNLGDNQRSHGSDDDDEHKRRQQQEAADGDMLEEKEPASLQEHRYLHKSASTGSALLDEEIDIASTCNELGVVLLKKGEYEDAIVQFKKSIRINDNNTSAWCNLAKALDSQGDSDGAEKAIQEALHLTPESVSALSLYGKILHAKGQHDEAIDAFRKALRLQEHPGDNQQPVDHAT